jgi:hypothetical protein
MAYTKYSLTPADNNAAPPNGAPEGMLPSAVNDTMRDMMSQIRDVGDGIRGGTYTMTAPVITGGSISGASVSATSLTDSGNLTFTGTGNRITGDFSNATVANRVAFQSSTTNSLTSVQIIPNGTSNAAAVQINNNSDVTNCAFGNFAIDAAGSVAIQSNIRGTGTYLPLTFFTSGLERLRIDTSGNVSQSAGSYFLPNNSGFGWGDLSTYVGGTSATDDIIFVTNATEKVRITSVGRVGIGTNNPVQLLQVSGTSLLGTTIIDNNGTMELGATGSGDRFALIDFHGSNSVDFSSRIIRNSGVNGQLAISNVGTGGVVIDSNAGIFTVNTSGAERFRIDTSGNVLQFAGNYLINNGSVFGWGDLSTYVGGNSSTDIINFVTSGAERSRFDASGNLLVGTTTVPSNAFSGVGGITATELNLTGGIRSHAGVGGAFNSNRFNFYWTGSAQLWVDSTNIGNLQVSSDYRIKRNIETQTAPALERVMALRPVTYQMADFKDGLFKAGEEVKEGFIAHEVQEIIPSGAEGVKDDENQIQSLRVDAILAVAVKAIQELNAKVTALEAQLGAK